MDRPAGAIRELFAHDLPGRLVLAQPEVARVAQTSVARPLREAHLGDERRLGPRRLPLPEPAVRRASPPRSPPGRRATARPTSRAARGPRRRTANRPVAAARAARRGARA